MADEGKSIDNNGDNEKDDAPVQDWEMLSMTMSASSVADLKSALSAETSQDSGDGGVADAAMHSQYFGQVEGPVGHAPASGDEGMNLDAGLLDDSNILDSGKEKSFEPRSDEHTMGHENLLSGVAVNRSDLSGLGSEFKCEIEQQILVSSLSSPTSSEKMLGTALEFSDAGQPSYVNETGYYQSATVELPTDEEAGLVFTVTEAAVTKSPLKEPLLSACKERAPKGWMRRRLQVLAKHVNTSSTLWSMAFVATVMGLVMIGRRWQQERLRNLQLELQLCCNEEKINQLANQLSEVKGTPAPAQPKAPVQSTSVFSSLRDFW